MIKKIERLIPVLQQQLEIRKTLLEHETGSKVNYLQAMQALIEQQQELEVQRSRQHEAENAVCRDRGNACPGRPPSTVACGTTI